MRRFAVGTVAVLGVAVLASGADCTRSWDLGGNSADGPVASGGTGQADGGLGSGARQGQGGAGTGGRPGTACDMRPVQIDIHVADVLLSVGRDASMSTHSGDSTRMAAVQAAVNTLITNNQKAVNWGYQDAPALTGCADSASCCVGSQQANPSPFSFAAAEQYARQCTPGAAPGTACVSQSDSRPVAEALSNALNLFNSLSHPGDTTDRYVVLIVDGTPGCVGEDATQACSSAIMATSMLSRASPPVQTYVVALGDEAAKDQCLQQIALMGGAQAAPYIFQVSDQSSDPNQLSKTLSSILSLVTTDSCTVDLQSPPVDPTKVSFYLSGMEIPYDTSGTDGWSFVAQSRVKIQVYGPSCRMVQTHPADIAVYSGCSPCGENFPCL